MGRSIFLGRSHPHICRDLCILNPFSDLFLHSKTQYPVILRSIWCYFPWHSHRHQIEGTNGFYCLIRKTLASGVNGIAKVPKRKVFTEVGFEPGRECPVTIPSQRSPTHSAISPPCCWHTLTVAECDQIFLDPNVWARAKHNHLLTKDRLKQIPTYLQLQTQSLTYFYSFIAALEWARETVCFVNAWCRTYYIHRSKFLIYSFFLC